MKTVTKLLAVCRNVGIMIEDHGVPYLNVVFDYDEGGTQGIGVYTLDASFVCRFMQAMGVTDLMDAVKKSCWVVQDEAGYISEVHPLHKKDGKPFVIKEWQEWAKRRTTAVSPSELMTGRDPNNR